VSNFELHSDRRAREREQFDQQQKQKEAEIEGMKRQVKHFKIIRKVFKHQVSQMHILTQLETRLAETSSKIAESCNEK
jgi:hypothetical protein